MIEQNQDMLLGGRPSSTISYSDALTNYRNNTDWWVVFASFDLADFQPSPLWIANKTNLSVDTVVEALEGLVVLGFLKKENESFYPVKGKDFIKFEVKGRKKAEVLNEHSLISRQILNQMGEDVLVAVDHRCFASNVEILGELYSDIAQAFEKAFKNSSNAKTKDRIFKMNFTAVDVLGEKGGQQ